MFNKAMLHIQLKSSNTRLYAFEHYTTKRGYLFMVNPNTYKNVSGMPKTK